MVDENDVKNGVHARKGVPHESHAGRPVEPKSQGDHNLRGAQGLQGGEGIAGKPGPQSEQVGEQVRGGKLQEKAARDEP